MTDPKRHHYVPQFYLKNFADESERVWVYDRATKEYRHQKTDQVAVIGHYYRIEKKDGTLSAEIERYLADEVEGPAATAMSKLERGEGITERERSDIAVFVALQMTRVPDFEKRVMEMQEKKYRKINKMLFPTLEETKRKIEESMDELKTMGATDVDAQQMYEFIHKDEYGIEIPRQNNIRMMLEMASRAAPHFLHMDWLLMRAAKGGAFITSDNPFTIIPPQDHAANSFLGVGLLTPGAKKGIPISPRATLFMLDPGVRYGENTAPRDKLRIFNSYFTQTSDRFIFARDEAHLRSVVERSRVDELPIDRERVIVS